MQTMEASHVFRDPIEEDRDGYTVQYQPADARSPFAIVSLHFEDEPVEVPAAAKAMEKELEHWLKKYAVPVKVSGYDSSNKLIRHSPHASECHLSGYVRMWDAAIVRRWAIMNQNEVPREQSGPGYLARAYDGVPYRVMEEDRRRLNRESHAKWRGIGAAVGLLLGGPLLVYLVRNGGGAVAVLIALTAIGFGADRLAGLLQWRKPRRREREQAERENRLEHCLYHCEKNAEAFERLKQENLEREVTEERKKEAAAAKSPAFGKLPFGRRLFTAVRAFRTAT